MDRLPTADGSLVQPRGAAGSHLRVECDSSHRLHGTSKTKILAETEHGLHAGIGTGSEINAGQQLAAVGRCLLHCGGNALTALAEGALLTAGHQAGLQLGMHAGALGDNHQRTILKPAQQRTVGGRAQGPGPIVLLGIPGARLCRKPLHRLVQAVQCEVDDGVGMDADVFAE